MTDGRQDAARNRERRSPIRHAASGVIFYKEGRETTERKHSKNTHPLSLPAASVLPIPSQPDHYSTSPRLPSLLVFYPRSQREKSANPNAEYYYYKAPQTIMVHKTSEHHGLRDIVRAFLSCCGRNADTIVVFRIPPPFKRRVQITQAFVV